MTVAAWNPEGASEGTRLATNGFAEPVFLSNTNPARPPVSFATLAGMSVRKSVWFAFIVLGFVSTTTAADVVVVCPRALEIALQPWLADRRARSLDVAVVRPRDTPEEQKATIDAHVDDATRTILLVGDAPVYGQVRQAGEVPTFERPTTVTAKFNSTRTLATDLPYAGVRVGRIAVGRLPVRSTEELAVVVSKILASDHSDDFGPWRGRVELVGGVGGFGMLIDATIESIARTIVTTSLPPSSRTGVLYGSPGHRFYPRGVFFRDAVTRRYNDGCRFWVYAGHGQVTALDHVPSLNGAAPPGPPVLDAASVEALDRSDGAQSIALLLACFNGAVDAPPRCFAEAMLIDPGGPIAVIAGSRVTMPYGNSKLAMALVESVYRDRAETLGAAWASTTGRMVAPEKSDGAGAVDGLLDAVATMMHGEMATADAERIEHASLYGLLGDPTMRLHPPREADIATRGSVSTGGGWKLVVSSPIGGRATVTLDRPLGAAGGGGDPNATTVWQSESVVVKDEDLTVLVDGSFLPGWYVARVHVAGTGQWATGGTKVFVRE